MRRIIPIADLAVDPDHLTDGTEPPLSQCIEVGEWRPLALFLYFRDDTGQPLAKSAATLTVDVLTVRAGQALVYSPAGPFILADRASVVVTNVAPGSAFVRVRAYSGSYIPGEAVDLVIDVDELPLEMAALQRPAVIESEVKTYECEVLIADMTGASASFPLTGAPTNYIALGAYVEIVGDPASSAPSQTDGLFCSAGTTGEHVIFGDVDAYGVDILGASGKVSLGPAPGFRPSEALRLWLTARLSPDSDGELSHITDLASIKFVLRYLET
jgi:hypothetical protein